MHTSQFQRKVGGSPIPSVLMSLAGLVLGALAVWLLMRGESVTAMCVAGWIGALAFVLFMGGIGTGMRPPQEEAEVRELMRMLWLAPLLLNMVPTVLACALAYPHAPHDTCARWIGGYWSLTAVLGPAESLLRDAVKLWKQRR